MFNFSKNLFTINTLFFAVILTVLLSEKNYAYSKNTLELENKAQLIISSQINAFQNFDINRAYSYASPFIKSKFTNAKIFGSMVKSAYPMIWEPKEFKFLDFTFFNESLIQRVLFIDKNEQIFMFDYEIKNYGEDSWLINGVYQIKKPSSGA